MKFRYLLIKDIKTVIYDVKSLIIIILMPIVLMTILGMSLQGVFGEETDSGATKTIIGIVKAYDKEEEMYKVAGKIDLDQYDLETVENMDPEKLFFNMMDNEDIKSFLTYKILSKEEGLKQLEEGDIAALITLPKDFVFNQYMMLTGSRIPSQIEYAISPKGNFFSSIVLGIINGYADISNNIYAKQRIITTELLSSGHTELLSDLDGVMNDTISDVASIHLEIQSTNKTKVISSFQYYAAAIMSMFLLYTAGIGGRALLFEKKMHTIPRLAASGENYFMIVLSNFFRVMVLAIVQSAIMIIYSALVLKIDWGSITTVLVTMLLSSFAVASLGMFIAVVTLIADNYKVANVFESVVINIMALVGGSFVQVEILPEPIRRFNFISINGQAIKMYVSGMYRLPLSESIQPITILLVFGVVFLVLSVILINRKGRAAIC